MTSKQVSEVTNEGGCGCRLLSDQELEQSVAGYANHGAATFSKGKATSRYTCIPKSDSPGPIYDVSAAPGIAKHQPCALLLLHFCMLLRVKLSQSCFLGPVCSPFL